MKVCLYLSGSSFTAEQMMSSDVPNDNETETIPSGIISAKNTEGKKTPPENGQCSFKITLRSQNATVMRTNFHGLAIDNALVCLDFDKLLCSVCFDTKLQHNRKLCFHDRIILGIIAVVLGFVKQALDCEYVPRLLGSYFKEKGIQFGAEHLFHFLTRHVAFIQSCCKGKDFFITSKSLPENYRANSLFTLWTVLMLTSQMFC